MIITFHFWKLRASAEICVEVTQLTGYLWSGYRALPKVLFIEGRLLFQKYFIFF